MIGKIKTVRFASNTYKNELEESNQSEDNEEQDTLTKAMIADCCNQINELKQVAVESQERKQF